MAAVELAELIRDLREELTRRSRQRPGRVCGLGWGRLGLEMMVAVAKEASRRAKVKFWVVEAGTDASVSRTATQRITLTLQPRIGESDVTPYVAGEQAERER